MKEKIRELFYSFLACFLFACAFSAALFFSILLIPLLIVALFVIAIKKMFVWRKKNKHVKDQRTMVVEYRETTVIRNMPGAKQNQNVA